MKKSISMLLVVGMVASLVMGCSTSSETTSETTGVETSGEAVEETEEVVITIFHKMSEEGKQNALQTLADNFSAEHEGVTFDIQSTDSGEYTTSLKTKISAGEAPDIMFGRPKSNTEFIEAGAVMDLSDQDYISSMQEEALPSLTVDESIYGIAMDVTAIGILYNKDVFDEYGLEVPTTLTEYDEVIATLEENGVTAFARGYQDSWTAQCEYQSNVYYVLSEYPDFFGDIQSGETSFSDYPTVVAALEVMKDHLTYSNDDIFGTSDQAAYEMVATGEAAMINQGFWGASVLQSISPDTNFGFFAPPISDDIEPLAMAFTDDAFMISETSEHKDICNEFFAYMLSEEGAQIWFEEAGQIPYTTGIDTSLITDQITLDVLSYIESGETYGYEDGETFDGTLDAVHKEYMELFPAIAADTEIEDFIEQLDAEFDAMR